MKVVPDTNVFISGLIFGGVDRKIINLAYSKKIVFFGSEGSYKEIERVVYYPKFKPVLETKIFSPEKILISYESLIEIRSINKEYEDLKIIKNDPDDDEFLKIAKSNNCKIIISQNKHLIKIKKYEDIHIIEPEEFWKIYPKISGKRLA